MMANRNDMPVWTIGVIEIKHLGQAAGERVEDSVSLQPECFKINYFVICIQIQQFTPGSEYKIRRQNICLFFNWFRTRPSLRSSRNMVDVIWGLSAPVMSLR